MLNPPHQTRREASLKFRIFAAALAAALSAMSGLASAAEPDPANWAQVETAARGQTVYFNAWGGSENINAYLEWAGKELLSRSGVKLVHVKLEDTASAVGKIVAEKAAGRNEGGSVDLIWINGENFASMKSQGLLLTPGWAERLPNWRFVDVEKLTFTVPVEGLESPWGMAKLVFFHDSARTKPADMPATADALLAWARAHPGRFSYPQPPDFAGSSFLKQVLSEKIADRTRLMKPVDEATFAADSKALFDWLDQLHPVAWRKGAAFPKNYPQMRQLLADGELDIIFAFNPSEASSAIASGELPDTVRSFIFPAGTLANTHFLGIPYNANARAGALVAANFLLSPEAQARKEDPKVWGDPTVLSLAKLSAEDRARFEKLELGVATLAPDKLGPALDEPHPSWMERIEKEWAARYGAGK